MEFRAPAGQPQQAWSTGPGPSLTQSLSPAGWHLLARIPPAGRGGSRLPYVARIGGALTARLRETETWKRASSLSVLCLFHPLHLCTHPSSPHPSPLSNHQSTITQQVWPAWSFLVLSFVPLSINPPPAITSHHLALRIASHRRLPAVDISASRPVRPHIDFFFILAFAFRRDD